MALRFICFAAFLAALFVTMGTTARADDRLVAQTEDAMRKAATFYIENAASHGGYVYHYLLDFSRRWGEGEATRDQIWVQPPGTPIVGMAFLDAYEATGDTLYLDAAEAAAEALVYGQITTGGWTNCIDFNPRGDRVAAYRNGQGRGRDTSSLDDGQTASAIRLMVLVDDALKFRNTKIHEAAIVSLDALLAAQFPNGGFPQVWHGPVSSQPIKEASYPNYDWRTEGRIKNYWDMYTLNDDVAGYVSTTLIDAYHVYDDERYLTSLKRLGDFLVLAQMPDPQPGWAQQYNYDMQPIWARKFEPPGVSGDESQEAIATLMKIYQVTDDDKYLEPIPRGLAYLKKSLLRDGRLARYYELQTNRPLYMERTGAVYSLTYDDSNLPSHYGWKTDARINVLERQFKLLRQGRQPVQDSGPSVTDVRRVLAALDKQGRWISTFSGERVVGQMKLPLGTPYLSSQVFSENLTLLSEYVKSSSSPRRP